MEGVSSANSDPRKPAGLPGLVLESPGSTSASWILEEWEEGRRGEEEVRQTGGPSRAGDQRKSIRHFSHPLGPGKPIELLGLVPCLLEPPVATWVLGV